MDGMYDSGQERLAERLDQGKLARRQVRYYQESTFC